MKRIMLVVLFIAILLSGRGIPVVRAEEHVTSEQATPALVTSEPSAAQGLVLAASTEEPIILKPAALEETQSQPEHQSVKISAVGDLMCLYGQLSAARRNGVYGFDYCYSQVSSRISGADLAIANLETLIAQGYPNTQSNQKGNPKMNGPETFLSAAKACGFDVLVNANNHIFDRKYDGINKTLQKIDEYGFMHTGAYSEGQTKEQLIIDVRGIKIAVLAYTGNINGHPKNVKGVNLYSESLVKSDIAEVKNAGADYIIVYVHWGKERTHKVTNGQKKAAAFIANAGADIILGSHPHCTQGTALIETDHGTVPVFYSMGNFVSSMGATICRDALIVEMTLYKDPEAGKTYLTSLTYIPTCYTIFSGRSWVVLPADLSYIAQSSYAKALNASRARTIKVLGNKVAQPQ